MMSQAKLLLLPFLMNTSIRLTLEDFGKFLNLPFEGESNEKCAYNLALYIESGYASELNLHDHVLYLIVTWILRPIKKHVVFHSIDYWWHLSYGAFRHAGYCFNLNTREWVQSELPATHEEDNVEGVYEDVPTPEHVPPLVSQHHVATSSSEINISILDAIHSLSNDLRGF
ncbi:hypothetical protein PVK06_007697 [Gossypium arboreum]|uniref:Uncharacterized protein n=1 Tax=Gossypium arboreum TaxID=29729 RepID=A0ABR0QI80_GOSAR|nr:hypothetical protein PVK06_007697 [Gossypium arboreum]